jgi:hypothetical protein
LNVDNEDVLVWRSACDADRHQSCSGEEASMSEVMRQT